MEQSLNAYCLRRSFSDIENCDSYRLDEFAGQKLDFVVDIGANVGLFSLHAAKIFPQAKVLAIEPCYRFFECLSHNVKDYSNISPIYAALGSGGCCKEVFDYERPLASYVEYSEDGDVPCLPLSDIFRIYGITGNYFLKIDCEGGESSLFLDSGAIKIIRGSVRTAMEIHFPSNINLIPNLKPYEEYKKWVLDNFGDMHILYHKSNRHLGRGIYVISKTEIEKPRSK